MCSVAAGFGMLRNENLQEFGKGEVRVGVCLGLGLVAFVVRGVEGCGGFQYAKDCVASADASM